MALNETLRNNTGSIEDVIHRVNRRADGISRIIGVIITLQLSIAKL